MTSTVESGVDSPQVVQVHAGCTPKKSQLKQVSSFDAKLCLTKILTRSQIRFINRTSSTCDPPVENDELTKTKKRKLQVKKSKISNIDCHANSVKTFLRRKPLQLDSSLKSSSVETERIDLVEPNIVVKLFNSDRSCMKSYDGGASRPNRSRRTTISSNVEMFAPLQHEVNVATPGNKVKRGLQLQLYEQLPAMRTDAGHTPLKPSHRKRRCSMYNERLI